MTRTHRRLSRALLVGLGGTLALGAVFWLGNLSARSSNQIELKRAQQAIAATQPVDRIAAQLQTPTTKPTAPLLGAIAETSITIKAPTTKPAPTAQVASNVPVPTPSPHAGAELRSSAAPDRVPSGPLSQARTLLDSAKLLEARRILNTALLSASLSEADQKSAKQLLNQINSTVVFSSKRFPDDELGGTFTVPSGGVLAKIANSHEVTADLLMRLNGITDARRLQAGQNIKVVKGPFNAVVDKSDFALELWLGEPGAKGSTYITSMPVGLGKDDSTPSGVWAVQNKLKNPAYFSPRGEGVIAADDPKNPLGERWIGLVGTDGHAVGKHSYGIHGTIDPTSIGKQESMGCIRLSNEHVTLVSEMLVEGKSTVTVRE